MKKNFVISAITGIIITLTLYITIIIKSGTDFELGLILAYIGIGFIGFIYSIILQRFKMFLAAKLFLFLTIISGIYFYISMPRGSDALSQLGSFLGWIVLMFISVVLPIIVELLNKLRIKMKK